MWITKHEQRRHVDDCGQLTWCTRLQSEIYTCNNEANYALQSTEIRGVFLLITAEDFFFSLLSMSWKRRERNPILFMSHLLLEWGCVISNVPAPAKFLYILELGKEKWSSATFCNLGRILKNNYFCSTAYFTDAILYRIIWSFSRVLSHSSWTVALKSSLLSQQISTTVRNLV